jgi:hypothetical protein
MTAAKLRARLFDHPRLPVTSGSADKRDVYIVGELSNFVESAVEQQGWIVVPARDRRGGVGYLTTAPSPFFSN